MCKFFFFLSISSRIYARYISRPENISVASDLQSDAT